MFISDEIHESLETLPAFQKLKDGPKNFIRSKLNQYQFTFQELRILSDISLDLQMWDEKDLGFYWPKEPPFEEKAPKQFKKQVLQKLQKNWNELRAKPISFENYQGLKETNDKPIQILKEENPNPDKIFGTCPVASEKTRCCNLITLDAIRNCGFDCSYCSIQTFSNGNKVFVQEDLAEKLATLKLDPNKFYHFGTGQASDSLMWGNQKGVLDALFDFARNNPNVILELKTKSKNINHLLKVDIPKNVLCTWTITPQVFIDNEEHLTAKLQDRIASARKIADKGNLVGFHLHPIPYYNGYQEDYVQIVKQLTDNFHHNEVALVSLGTLTFTKKVVKQIRTSRRKSKILQMPMEDAAGKLSYPFEVKKEMFKHVYDQFKPWHGKMYFYLCMEDQDLWQPVFGFHFKSNDEMEEAMKNSYMNKIRSLN